MKTIGPRSLAGGLKVISYIAFSLGILYFLFQMWGFTVIFRHADDLGQYMPMSSSIYQLTDQEPGHREYRSENGRVQLTLHGLYGELRYRNMTRRVVLVIWFGELVLFFCFFTAIIQLANLFEDLSAGKVFEADGAVRMRRIGLAVVGGTLFSPLWNVLWVWLFRGDILVPGTRIPWILFVWTRVNLGLLLGGLLLLVMAEAFRIGHVLREEQQLTV
jgi:hypothetical protein